MRILIACEYSGRVRDAFRAVGHDAISCDIIPSERPGPHHLGDVRELLEKEWDAVIAFPPCTRLSCVGAKYWADWREDGSQQKAIDFFMMFANLSVPKLCIENPAGIMSTVWRKPDQYINPFQFGEPWTKRTGLWLRGLPKLEPTSTIKRWESKYWIDGGSNPIGSGKDGAGRRQKDRARTFQCIADAMAQQWGTAE